MTVLANDGVLPLAPERGWPWSASPAGRPCCRAAARPRSPRRPRPRSWTGWGRPAGRVTYTGGVEIGPPPPARPGFVVDPVDGRPGMRVQLIAADGAVLLEEHVVDSRRLVGLATTCPARSRAIRLAARIESPGPLQLGVIGIGTWTVEGRRGAPDGRRGAGQRHARRGDPRPADAAARSRRRRAGRRRGRTRAGRRPRLVGLVARPAPLSDEQAIEAAVAAARDADVAVVVVGLTEEQETESRDKATLALPGAQDALVTAVAAAAGGRSSS